LVPVAAGGEFGVELFLPLVCYVFFASVLWSPRRVDVVIRSTSHGGLFSVRFNDLWGGTLHAIFHGVASMAEKGQYSRGLAKSC
jgi:hypothetical protein